MPTRWDALLAEFGRREEAYAAAVVEYVLKARVERRDFPVSPQGTVDAEVIYPDGRSAALEITSVENNRTWHLRARLDRMRPTPAPGKFLWMIRPNTVEELDRLVTIHERVIDICEEWGVGDPEYLPGDVIAADADLTWLAWEGFLGRMSGHDVSSDPRVYWEYPIESAVWGNDADEIVSGLTAVLKIEPSVGHIAKLLRDPHDERHLFLVVGTTGLSNAAAFALIEPDEVPTVDPELPIGLDNLWLGPGWGETVTMWNRVRGWSNETARQQPDDAR